MFYTAKDPKQDPEQHKPTAASQALSTARSGSEVGREVEGKSAIVDQGSVNESSFSYQRFAVNTGGAQGDTVKGHC